MLRSIFVVISVPFVLTEGVTCGDVKDAYKDGGCCGNPNKVFNEARLCNKDAPTDGRPNILVLKWDGWRWDFDGTHDDIDMRGTLIQRITDNGVRFDKAYNPSPICAPSRTAFMLGRDFDDSPVQVNAAQASTTETIMERLQDVGYFTMVTGKDHTRRVSGVGLSGDLMMKEFGWDAQATSLDIWEFAEEGFEPSEPYGHWLESYGAYDQMVRDFGTFPFRDYPARLCGGSIGLTYYCPKASNISDQYGIDVYNTLAAKQLFGGAYLGNAKARKKPWFMWLNLMGGHPPLILSERLAAESAGREIKPPVKPGTMPQDEVAFARVAYTAMLEDIDVMSNDILDFFDATSPGGLANILVMVTADHGEMIGDYDMTDKKTQHEASNRVPLAIMGPGVVPRGRVIDTPVTTLDIAGTALAAAGARPATGMTTVSLFPLINSGTKVRDVVEAGVIWGPNNRYNLRMRWKTYSDGTTLKLFCCKQGCPESTMIPKTTDLQVGLFTVTEKGDGEDVLRQRKTEALELLATMTQEFQDLCRPLIENA